MRCPLPLRRLAALLAVGLACGGAVAHDSWFARVPGAASQDLRLALGTGNRYPKVDVAPPPESVAAAGCVDGRAQRVPLQAERVDGPTLSLRSPARGPAACWLELKPASIRLEPAIVNVYFKEIQPPADVRTAWAELQSRGIGWEETYRKFARIEVAGPDATPEALRAVRTAFGLPLEFVVVGDAPLVAGAPARFRVLADGQPFAGVAVELVSERSPLGVWARSDAAGEVQWTLPFAGAWLVRATSVQREEASTRWTSRFATLTFEAAAK